MYFTFRGRFAYPLTLFVCKSEYVHLQTVSLYGVGLQFIVLATVPNRGFQSLRDSFEHECAIGLVLFLVLVNPSCRDACNPAYDSLMLSSNVTVTVRAMSRETPSARLCETSARRPS